MATKKKTEVEATEVVEEVKSEVVEEVKAEAPKKTSKKSSKKAEVVEEVKEEASVAEPAPVVEEVKEVKEVKEAPKKEKASAAPVATSDSFEVQVISASGIYSFKNPGLDQPKGKVYPKGAKLIVSEVKGNWGKVGQNAWIILSCVAKL